MVVPHQMDSAGNLSGLSRAGIDCYQEGEKTVGEGLDKRSEALIASAHNTGANK
jgi:hypothetical protein